MKNVTKLSLGLRFGDDIICLVDSFRQQKMKKDVTKQHQESMQRQLRRIRYNWNRKQKSTRNELHFLQHYWHKIMDKVEGFHPTQFPNRLNGIREHMPPYPYHVDIDYPGTSLYVAEYWADNDVMRLLLRSNGNRRLLAHYKYDLYCVYTWYYFDLCRDSSE
jgi:hypothetical protein